MKQKQILIQKQKYKNTKRMNDKLIEEIVEVKDKYGLTAENLLAKAKNKNSELHSHFEWNDDIASEKYRLYQARILINEVEIIVKGSSFPAFESVKLNSNSREYKNSVEIIDSKILRVQILQRAINQIKYWRETYKKYNYGELQPIFSSIDRVEKGVNKKWLRKKK